MLSSYQTLFSVAVEHDYNQDGICNCLIFEPTENTRAIFSNAGVLQRKISGGIQIVCDGSGLETLQQYAEDPEELLSFDFRVFATDADFRSYSEPFSAHDDEYLYFDNRQAKGSKKIALHTGKNVSVGDFRSVDSSAINAVLGTSERLPRPVFVLRIFAKPKKITLLQQWFDEAIAYRIKFGSRHRYWKYYLLGGMVNAGDSGAVYSVVDSENRIEFEATGEAVLSNRQRAYTFRSKQLIPLTEKYHYRFQLKQKGRNSDNVVIPRLPFASVKQVGMEVIARQQALVSEIYINT